MEPDTTRDTLNLAVTLAVKLTALEARLARVERELVIQDRKLVAMETLERQRWQGAYKHEITRVLPANCVQCEHCDVQYDPQHFSVVCPHEVRRMGPQYDPAKPLPDVGPTKGE